ncbi:TetR/AcrR family transcriptional regulator [Haliangium sp.]|uniref:TetR/AcrR family transcriptional regulator n=1 Tax=Haliangium sp. TaxID=2663208 RepID=UPI003D1142ED
MAQPKKSGARRRQPRQERAAVTVDALLQATAELLVHDGYERTTTNHIARRAGVSIGSLYHYFGSKDALVVGLIERHFAGVEAIITESLADTGDESFRDQVSDLIRALVRADRSAPALRYVIMSELPRVGSFAIIDTFSARIETQVAAALETYRSELRPSSPLLAAQIIVRATSGLMQSTLRRDPALIDDPAFEAELLALILRYLLH